MICLLLSSCNKETPEEKFKRICPYKWTFEGGAGHYLKMPIEINPHKKTYQVGDTLSITVNASDSIYDLNSQEKFKIIDFPFEPIAVVYRFTSDTNWESYLARNTWIIDSSQYVKYLPAVGAEGIKVRYNYENDVYSFEMGLILTKPGRYIFHLHEDTNLLDEDTEEGKFIRSFPFEGRCPTVSLFTNMIVSGDDNLDSFEPELLYIDKQLALDNWTTWGPLNYDLYGSGALKWEWEGTFGFEVVE